MRFLLFRLFAPVALLLAPAAAIAAEALIFDRTFNSQVLGESRNYRIFLPPDYETSGKRYPVIYWFHGHSERSFKAAKDYDLTGYNGDTIAAYVSNHDVIVAKIDGYNPRTPGEQYVRPWNISPVETNRQFPLMFPEFIQHIDSTYRTIADREHRATAGLSMGGFMSFWVSGKYPHLVSSASNFMGSSEFFVGPKGFDVEYRHDEMRENYHGVRTRLIMGTKDFILFYHQRMTAIWKYAKPHHHWETFEHDHGTPGMARTFDFHMNAFAKPLPRPAVWTHHDVYPNFDVWGWDVVSNRRQPGFTTIANVSAEGFRSAVREWLLDGPVLPKVKLTVTSGPLYPPKKPQMITIVRVRDGRMQREMRTADEQGRVSVELDGEEQEVGIGQRPVLTLNGWRLEELAWATAGRPVTGKVRFWNKGALATKPVALKWQSDNPDITWETQSAALPAIPPGQSVEVPLVFTVGDPTREIVRMHATDGQQWFALEIPLFPPAEPAGDFVIADGMSNPVYQRAIQVQQVALGNGNANGKPAPGERFAVLLKDGDAYRTAEVFTNDPCLTQSTRLSDVWSRYDNVGASTKVSLFWVSADCRPGHVLRMLARVQLPNKPLHSLRYAVVQVPVEVQQP